MKQETILPASLVHPGRHLELLGETINDPFQETCKLSEPAVCSNCNAVYRDGRWQWITTPIDAYLTRCPACKRISQKIPAGYVTIRGSFAHDHRNEMLSLVHHLETREKTEHPLKRIMWIEYQEDGLTVTTTDIHLAHSIGEALQRAYKGDLDYHFCDAEYKLRVHWQR
jgi:NMD protein affecting ribosome stability and mRNA decay